MLKIENLSIEVEQKRIIENFSLSIPKDEIHVIMGPNGTGKSTILKTIMGHPDYKVTSGSIYYNNERIDTPSSK